MATCYPNTVSINKPCSLSTPHSNRMHIRGGGAMSKFPAGPAKSEGQPPALISAQHPGMLPTRGHAARRDPPAGTCRIRGPATRPHPRSTPWDAAHQRPCGPARSPSRDLQSQRASHPPSSSLNTLGCCPPEAMRPGEIPQQGPAKSEGQPPALILAQHPGMLPTRGHAARRDPSAGTCKARGPATRPHPRSTPWDAAHQRPCGPARSPSRDLQSQRASHPPSSSLNTLGCCPPEAMRPGEIPQQGPAKSEGQPPALILAQHPGMLPTRGHAARRDPPAGTCKARGPATRPHPRSTPWDAAHQRPCGPARSLSRDLQNQRASHPPSSSLNTLGCCPPEAMRPGEIPQQGPAKSEGQPPALILAQHPGMLPTRGHAARQNPPAGTCKIRGPATHPHPRSTPWDAAHQRPCGPVRSPSRDLQNQRASHPPSSPLNTLGCCPPEAMRPGEIPQQGPAKPEGQPPALILAQHPGMLPTRGHAARRDPSAGTCKIRGPATHPHLRSTPWDAAHQRPCAPPRRDSPAGICRIRGPATCPHPRSLPWNAVP